MSYGCKAYFDAQALKHNFQIVKQRAPAARIVSMIKANGYGHGAVWAAQQLTGSDAFGVARLAEAIELRQAGICQPIVLCDGILDQEDLRQALAYQIDLVLHDIYQLDLLEQSPGSGTIKAWIKIDTGMHRLGFLPEQLAQVFTQIKRCAHIDQNNLRLMTHFACADDLDDDFTQQQIEIFEKCTHDFAYEKSLANSAGIMGWPKSHQNWVRPGIMLYGISPLLGSTGDELGLLPVMTLKTEIIAVRQLKKGDRVGYSGLWECPTEMTVAVLAAGYGDGYPRYITAGCPVLFRERQLPILGRVSMDMMVIDVTGMNALCGESVTLWGQGLPVETIAHWANTSPYELLCGVTPRVERYY